MKDESEIWLVVELYKGFLLARYMYMAKSLRTERRRCAVRSVDLAAAEVPRRLRAIMSN